MPRFLAIDWDPPKLNLLGVNIAKGKARVETSLSFSLTQDLTPASAAALGRQLKEALAMVDVKVLDHFIVAGRATLSFAERGLL